MIKPALQDQSQEPGNDGRYNEALALHRAGKLPEAAEIYRALIAEDPRRVGSWCNLAVVLEQMQRFEAAVAVAKRALERRPDNPSFQTNCANMLVAVDRLDEAIALHEKAVATSPKNPDARRCYGIALTEAGRIEEALAQFDQILAANPKDADTRWLRSVNLLTLGKLGEAWPEREARWDRGIWQPAQYDAPLWRGEDVAEKTVFIYEDQGFGDSILCSRYIPMVKALGANVILRVRPELQRLFQRLPGVDRISDPGKRPASFDYHLPVMSLPGIFKTELNSIPPAAPLSVPLAPPPEAARLLGLGKNRARIGIVWSGSESLENFKRATKLNRFLALAEIPGVQLYSLQKGPRVKELDDNAAHSFVTDLGPHLHDFADTAAALKQLDLVIMTDSSVAHLAGALGKPVWNLLSYRPYWLYMRDRADCPWYPSMRLFRQPKPGDWDSVFREVAEALRQKIRKK
jgi:tetratricopeptide (TPR) repeat protein